MSRFYRTKFTQDELLALNALMEDHDPEDIASAMADLAETNAARCNQRCYQSEGSLLVKRPMHAKLKSELLSNRDFWLNHSDWWSKYTTNAKAS